MKQKILVTGGCGFLGANLVHEALLRGYSPIVFDNLYRAGSDRNLSWLQKQGSVKFIHGDVRDFHDLQIAIDESPDAVFHLAGQVAMTTSISQPIMDFDVNARGTLNLLTSLKARGMKIPVLYSSTNKVYGDLEDLEYAETESRYVVSQYLNGFDERLPFAPSTPYGLSKATADMYIREWSRLFDFPAVVFRHSSMYGDLQNATIDQGWVSWFCGVALERRKDPKYSFTVSGSGKQVRDVLHASDMRSLYFSALQGVEKLKGRAFNVGAGVENSLSILELLWFLQEKVGCDMKPEFLAPRSSDQKVFIADVGELRRSIGWSPQKNYREGLSESLQWIGSSQV
jgi:CDP-paratose 2-epimerase